jgi:hypothetical protein
MAEKPFVPDFSKRLDSSKSNLEAVVEPNKDPHLKKHGSAPVTIGPRYLHIPGKAPQLISGTQ